MIQPKPRMGTSPIGVYLQSALAIEEQVLLFALARSCSVLCRGLPV